MLCKLTQQSCIAARSEILLNLTNPRLLLTCFVNTVQARTDVNDQGHLLVLTRTNRLPPVTSKISVRMPRANSDPSASVPTAFLAS